MSSNGLQLGNQVMRHEATKEKLALLNILRHRPIAYHVEFARIGGGVTAGLFLSQLFFWSDKGSDEDGWIYKTGEQWKKETGLTRREQESARTALKKRGLIEEKRSGLPARLFFKVKIDAIIDKLAENPDEDCDKQECTKRTNKNVRNVQTGMYETYKLETPDEASNDASLQPVPEPPEITTEITSSRSSSSIEHRSGSSGSSLDDDDDERRVEKAKDIHSPPQRLLSTEEPTEPVELEPTVIDPPHILAFDGTPPEAQAIKDTLLTTLNHVRVEVARRNNLPAPPPRRELSRSDRETLDKWLAYAQEQDLPHEDLTEAIQSTLTEVSERCKTVPGGAAYYLQPVFEAMQYRGETRKARVVHELNIDRTQALLAEYAAAREAKTRSKNEKEG